MFGDRAFNWLAMVPITLRHWWLGLVSSKHMLKPFYMSSYRISEIRWFVSKVKESSFYHKNELWHLPMVHLKHLEPPVFTVILSSNTHYIQILCPSHICFSSRAPHSVTAASKSCLPIKAQEGYMVLSGKKIV